MRKAIALFLILALSSPAWADVFKGEAMYAGGTAPMKEGTLGRLETQDAQALIFLGEGGTRLAIPYTAIRSFRYRQERARHLGVALTIAVGILKRLQRRHFFNIDYTDEHGAAQAVIFEVAKDDAEAVRAVLQTKAPRAQTADADGRCRARGVHPEEDRGGR
jgi:hypothetical protein